MANLAVSEELKSYPLTGPGPSTTTEEALITASLNGNTHRVKVLLENGALVNQQNDHGQSALIKTSQNGHTEIAKLLLDSGAVVNLQENDGWSALIIASENGHTKTAKFLLQSGGQVNLQNDRGWSALMLASENGHNKTAKLLVEHGAQVNLQDSEGWSALTHASQSGHTETAKLLLQNGAQVNVQNVHGQSALILACQNGFNDTAKLLLKNGARVNLQNNHGQSALIKSSQNGYTKMVGLLLDNGAQVDLQSNHQSALIIASQNGHTETAKVLLENGAQVNLQDNCGWPALMRASQKGHTETVKLLLENGAQVNLQDGDGWSALKIASQDGHTEAAKLLLENGAQVNLQTNNGWSALMIAIQYGHTELARLLLENGAQVNVQDNEGSSALMLASQEGCRHAETAKLLLENGALVDLQDNVGWSALMVACQKGQTAPAKLLLENGAQINLQTNNGWSALMIASQNGHTEIVKLLLENGAQVNLQDNHRQSALMVTSIYGHTEIARLLLENGAQVNLQNDGGSSALILASIAGETEAAKVLLENGAQVNLKLRDGRTAMSLANTNKMLDLLMSAMLPQLTELLHPITNNWKELGKNLGLNELALQIISNSEKTEEGCLQAVMNRWSTQDKFPTWRVLVRAVRSVDIIMAQRMDQLVDPKMRYSKEISGDEEDSEENIEEKIVDEEDLMKESTEEVNVINKAMHLAAVEEAINKQGKLEHTLAHGAIVGPAGSGKSSLMSRLVREMPSSNLPSTGVANRVVQVEVRKSSSIAVGVCNKSSLRTWLKMLYDEEAVQLMLRFISASNCQKQPIDPLLETPSTGSVTVNPDSTSSQVPSNPPLGVANASSLHKSDSVKASSVTLSLPRGYIPPMTVFRNALQQECLDKLRQHFEKSWSLYLTDSGGQVEFQEVLPLLVSGPSIFFITFRLDQELNQRFMIEYRLPDGGRSEPYQSTLTVEEAILQTLASVASMGTFTYSSPQMERLCVPLKPKVFIVGTHKDKVDECKVKEIDEYLQKVIKSTSHYHEDLVEFSDKSQLIFTVNNLSEEDHDFEKIRLGVDRAVNRGHFKVSFPSKWLVFSLVLRQQMIEDRIIRYDQCFAIAKDCGITDHEELNHALWFLHTKIGLVRHFPTPGLSDFVIRDPQILFDQVTHLIVKTFTFESVGKKHSDQFKHKGIFSLEDIKKVNKEWPSEQLPPEKLLELLQHLRVIAKFQEGPFTKYFIPCVLAHSEVSESRSLQHNSSIPPLLITFKCGYCPKGVFGALLMYLLTNEMGSKFKWELKTNKIFRDEISFLVSPYDIITLKIHPIFLELIHFPTKNATNRTKSYSIQSVCNNVREFVEKGIKKVSANINLTSDAEHSVSFYCQDSDCVQNNGPHPATNGVLSDDDSICSLLCEKSGEFVTSHPPDGCNYWLGMPGTVPEHQSCSRKRKHSEESKDDQSKIPRITGPPSRPSSSSSSQASDLPQLCDVFKLLIPMASEWENLAVLLSIPHSLVKEIREDHTTVRNCLRAMLTEWLNQTNPLPSWNTLAEAVELLGDPELAKEIRDKYIFKQ